MESAEPTRISAAAVSHSYQRGPETVHAVREVSWQLRPAELIVVTGPSGSGKTTLLNLLAGIEKPSDGSVVVLGQPLSDLSERDRAAFRLRHLGMVFQDHNLVAEFSATENVELPLLLLGMGRKHARAAATKALEVVGLGPETMSRPSQLSGGQRQRVGLARALAGDRSILLADEPTGSVDAEAAEDIFARLRSLADAGMTVVLATHDLRAAAHAHRVSSMLDGRLIESRP